MKKSKDTWLLITSGIMFALAIIYIVLMVSELLPSFFDKFDMRVIYASYLLVMFTLIVSYILNRIKSKGNEKNDR